MNITRLRPTKNINVIKYTYPNPSKYLLPLLSFKDLARVDTTIQEIASGFTREIRNPCGPYSDGESME